MISINTPNGIYHFNEFEGINVNVTKPSLALYIQQLDEDKIQYLGIEYIENPKSYFKTFSHPFIEQIDKTLIYQTFQDDPSEQEIMNLKNSINVIKRTINFSYDL